MISIEFFHYAAIALTVAINAIGVGIGQGLASRSAIKSLNTQPQARDDITKATILGMALIETSAIMGTFVGLLLLFGPRGYTQTFYTCFAQSGIAFAMCFSGFTIGIVSALPTRAACEAIARQPFIGQRIVRFLLLTLSLIQTPVIFGLITALVIHSQMHAVTTLKESMRLIAGGLSIGLGSVGPTIGLALFAQAACTGLGVNRHSYSKLLPFTFISQAIIETPIIFALIISIILLFMVPQGGQENMVDTVIYISAALCTGLGTIGTGISSGKTAASACQQIALNPDLHPQISRVSMFAQGLIETSAIYPVLISLTLLFAR